MRATDGLQTTITVSPVKDDGPGTETGTHLVSTGDGNRDAPRFHRSLHSGWPPIQIASVFPLLCFRSPIGQGELLLDPPGRFWVHIFGTSGILGMIIDSATFSITSREVLSTFCSPSISA